MFIAFCAVASFAQGRFSIGAELSLPQGDWGDFVGMGFGGTVRYEAPINSNLSWMGTAGYVAFGEKDDSGLTMSMIPVTAGAKYYFTESFTGFYAGADLGMFFATVKLGDASESDSEFGFAPMVGYHLGAIDIGAKYQIISDANFVGFRIAYVLGGK